QPSPKRFEKISTWFEFVVITHGFTTGFVITFVASLARPGFNFLERIGLDGMQPVDLAALRRGKLHIAIQIHGVKREIDFLHVAPVELILNFRARQKYVADADVHLRISDVSDLLLRLLPITRF